MEISNIIWLVLHFVHVLWFIPAEENHLSLGVVLSCVSWSYGSIPQAVTAVSDSW